MTIRWFLSRKVRLAAEMFKHVQKLLNAQRDILSPPAIAAVSDSLAQTKKAIDSHTSIEALEKQVAELEATANKWLKPYPNHAWRENVEVLLVAIAVAMAIRTFFLQPFKIPTGSMQPTLYGVTLEPFSELPNRFERIKDAFVQGAFYHHLVAEEDGQLVKIGPAQHFLKFINKQTFTMEYLAGPQPVIKNYTLWFTPDEEKQFEFLRAAGLQEGKPFRKGEEIIKLKEITGDHLFVDRMTYNFRHPRRGEIIVFKTAGIQHPNMRQDQFYIKRLVALGSEHVRIGNDRHLIIDGKRLDAATPHFENVYSFTGPPQESHYSGHVNGLFGPVLTPNFPDESQEYIVATNHYMVMGDNTINSFDSRGWGDFPRENVIGKSYFIYWPIANRGGSRFGWGYR
ncbi:MAG: signal peptidase I [Verrucomicrobiota bacterium]|nr:signal peptidase I [Verrucomicrobiota bacterium]